MEASKLYFAFSNKDIDVGLEALQPDLQHLAS